MDFFAERGHETVSSSSLVPGNDPTLLFTNAGMVQFKDVFLGADKRAYTRATSSQRCVRAGGKHNDLENVGYTARHHTFFEMLGNFSFGDYFKREAIHYGWEFLTQTLGLPPEKLWVTAHISDDEAADIWIKDVGIDPARFSRLDEDNFWQMGDTGPCGPCSEIFYDHGESVWGGPPGSPEEDGDRYIEIWNLVFMQYERQKNGELVTLPNPSIDTGMGLERIAAVMQGVHNNYDIDLFQALIKAASSATGESDLTNQSLRVIADHIRSCSFLVVDGVLPSNEGRGYVLRRIIRRALRHGNKLGAEGFFFNNLVDALSQEMGDAYPELVEKRDQIKRILLAEEEQFAKTLDKGMLVLDEAIQHLDNAVLPGELVFKLHDTYGFPTDLTNDIARERGLTLDMEEFEACMQAQRDRARAANKFGQDYNVQLDRAGETEFAGYTSLEVQGVVEAILIEGQSVTEIAEGQSGIVILDKTAFYAESGGQVGDQGLLTSENSRFEVANCNAQSGHHLHAGTLVSGVLRVADSVTSQVDSSVRQATALNHSATHLLHAALREILGEHVNQQGSLVSAERLRFDFSHFEALKPEQLSAVEKLVNEQIRRNSSVETDVMTMELAKEKGAMALFGEKYGDQVRVLTMGEGFSVELCGGTHAERTGDIGIFKVVSESGVASGVRRVEAVTAGRAEAFIQATEVTLSQLAMLFKTDNGLVEKAQQLIQKNRELQRDLDQLQIKVANSSGKELVDNVKEVNGIKLLVAKLDGVDPKNLRTMVDQQKDKIVSGVVLLGTVSDGKVGLVCGVTKDLTDRVQAGKILAEVAAKVGGKGGGRPDMAQGGGTQPENLVAALDSAIEWLQVNS